MLEPLGGLGPIRLGASRASVEALPLGRADDFGARLSFDEGRLQVSFSAEGKADHIGFTPDFGQRVAFRREVLQGHTWDELIRIFAPGVFVVDPEDPTTTICADLSLALWRRFDPAETQSELQDLEAEGADPELIASLREEAASHAYPEQIALAVAGYW